MKAFVDPELCIGCTQCAGLCPEVYQMEGTLAVAIPGDIPPDQVPLAVDAANSWIRRSSCSRATRCAARSTALAV